MEIPEPLFAPIRWYKAETETPEGKKSQFFWTKGEAWDWLRLTHFKGSKEAAVEAAKARTAKVTRYDVEEGKDGLQYIDPWDQGWPGDRGLPENQYIWDIDRDYLYESYMETAMKEATGRGIRGAVAVRGFEAEKYKNMGYSPESAAFLYLASVDRLPYR